MNCKHCGQKFKSMRGFKMHIRKQHLKRYNFLCPYCDRSANLESIIEQHVQAKHPGQSIKAIINSFPKKAELTDEFWEREYEMPSGKERRGQKRKASVFEDPEKGPEIKTTVENAYVCLYCNFVAMTLSGHISHQKTHKLLFKCAYCSFTGTVRNEVKKHSKTDHPHLTAHVEEVPIIGKTASSSSCVSSEKTNSVQKIEDEDVTKMKKSFDHRFSYWCYYCSVRCKSMFAMKKHWTRSHKDPKPDEATKFKTGPFKYTIVQAPTASREIVQSSLKVCPSGSQNVETSAASDGWICEWCEEFCEGRKNMEYHHNLFHSHLPLKCIQQQNPIQVLFIKRYLNSI